MSPEQLTHLCRLANVPVPADEADRVRLQTDLGRFMTFVQRVQDDAPAVEPLTSVSVAAPARAVAPPGSAPADALPLAREQLLAGAAETRDGFIVFKN